MGLIDLLRTTDFADASDGGTNRVLTHRAILSKRPMIRSVFEDFYHRIRRLDHDLFGNVDGLKIELGSGSSMLKDYYPDVITSDVVSAPHLDLVLDATRLDLPDDSVRVLYGINCFHHFPDPQAFFQEVARVVRPGGGVILIDPYYGPLASFLYKRLFKEEGFDRSSDVWRAAEQADPNKPNQALSYVVLIRDRERFERENPMLSIATHEIATNYIRYLLSGGLNFRQLAPTASISSLRLVERILSPARTLFGLHHILVLRRK